MRQGLVKLNKSHFPEKRHNNHIFVLRDKDQLILECLLTITLCSVLVLASILLGDLTIDLLWRRAKLHGCG